MPRFAMRRRNSWLIAQNVSDRELLVRNGVVDIANMVLIQNSGIDLELFWPMPEPERCTAGYPAVAAKLGESYLGVYWHGSATMG